MEKRMHNRTKERTKNKGFFFWCNIQTITCWETWFSASVVAPGSAATEGRVFCCKRACVFNYICHSILFQPTKPTGTGLRLHLVEWGRQRQRTRIPGVSGVSPGALLIFESCTSLSSAEALDSSVVNGDPGNQVLRSLWCLLWLGQGHLALRSCHSSCSKW